MKLWPDKPKKEISNLEKYVDFCRSPLNKPMDSCTDYENLISQKAVLGLSFKPASDFVPQALVVITDDININYLEENYHIGRFAIFIFRRQDPQGYWIADFRFRNLTRVIGIDHESRSFSYMSGNFYHPHIIEDTEAYGFPLGRLCIQKGAFPIKTAIRMGRISEAVSLLVKILNTYQDNNPYAFIQLWSSKEKTHA